MFSFSAPTVTSNVVRRFFSTALFAILIAAFSGVALAQDEVFTTSTALVQLNVGVVDKQGHAITSLSKNDFTVFEDGVRQPIFQFESTDAPFSLVMMLDMSGSTVNFRQQIRGAALRFLDMSS